MHLLRLTRPSSGFLKANPSLFPTPSRLMKASPDRHLANAAAFRCGIGNLNH